jgi:cytochrome oxidase assembly protein ShyY1
VLRAVVWTLRQRRYTALAVAGLIVALISVGAGTFEIHRFREKRHDNGVLRANAHAAVAPLTTDLVPVTGDGKAPSDAAIRYRRVSATGRYVVAQQQYVGNQTQDGRQGFYVLTPLRSPAGTLLVVRGFVAATNDETRPARVPAPPTGAVRVTGWLAAAQTASDQFGRLGHGEIMSINPGQQAARLGTPVYQAYLTLTARQPGTARLATVPLPGLGNPSGGAAEWQLLSYVVQWYVFAVLALAMPFFVSRSEVREARRRYLGVDPGAAQLDDLPPRRVLASGSTSSGAELVPRGPAELAERTQLAAQLERASRLADRYGRSLGLDPEEALAAPRVDGALRPPVRDSSATPHRSEDAYHAGYNDYLWKLALADGGMPDVFDESQRPIQRIEQVASEDEPPAEGEAPVP